MLISPPWAKDANGKSIITHYEIQDNTLIQVVKHGDSDTVYPVVADPTTGFATCFSSWSWNYNSTYSGWTLSLIPTSFLITQLNGNNYSGYKVYSWDQVNGSFSSYSYWTNTASMKGQFDCHVDFARNKSSWNLDTWRPTASLLGYIASQCNP
jgi:hypothetical protein